MSNSGSKTTTCIIFHTNHDSGGLIFIQHGIIFWYVHHITISICMAFLTQWICSEVHLVQYSMMWNAWVKDNTKTRSQLKCYTYFRKYVFISALIWLTLLVRFRVGFCFVVHDFQMQSSINLFAPLTKHFMSDLLRCTTSVMNLIVTLRLIYFIVKIELAFSSIHCTFHFQSIT